MLKKRSRGRKSSKTDEKRLIQEDKEHQMTCEKLSSLIIIYLKFCLLDFFEHVQQKLAKRRKQKRKSSKRREKTN